MNRSELRGWISDALARHERDQRERDETPADASVAEIVDAVWGRLPLEVRRATSRARVQAGLTILAATEHQRPGRGAHRLDAGEA